jgi:hypothetical protein
MRQTHLQKHLAIIPFLFVIAANVVSQAAPHPLVQGEPNGATTPQNPFSFSNIPTFQFRLRTAFMLTPAMVVAIQSASARPQNFSSENEKNPVWNDPVMREVNLASSFGIKIQSDQMIALIIFMPVQFAKKEVTLLVQNQVYAQSPDSSIQLSTSVHTMRIPLGSIFYYYPLGEDLKQGAPVVIEILIDKK